MLQPYSPGLWNACHIEKYSEKESVSKQISKIILFSGKNTIIDYLLFTPPGVGSSTLIIEAIALSRF
jgi:hypothetical protein